MQQLQFVFASLERAKAGLQEYTDCVEEPVHIIRIEYGRDGIEYQYRRQRDTVGKNNIVATAHPKNENRR